MAKKIGAITTLVIVAIVIITTIVLGSVKIEHNINYKTPNEIWIKYNGKIQVKMHDEHVEKVLNLLDSSTEESLLTAIINQTVDYQPELKQNQTYTTSIPSNSDFYMIFEYENLQKVKYQDKDVYYKGLVFTIAETEGKTDVKVYISEDNDMQYRYYYVINVDYSEVYNFLIAEKDYT